MCYSLKTMVFALQVNCLETRQKAIMKISKMHRIYICISLNKIEATKTQEVNINQLYSMRDQHLPRN